MVKRRPVAAIGFLSVTLIATGVPLVMWFPYMLSWWGRLNAYVVVELGLPSLGLAANAFAIAWLARPLATRSGRQFQQENALKALVAAASLLVLYGPWVSLFAYSGPITSANLVAAGRVGLSSLQTVSSIFAVVTFAGVPLGVALAAVTAWSHMRERQTAAPRSQLAAAVLLAAALAATVTFTVLWPQVRILSGSAFGVAPWLLLAVTGFGMAINAAAAILAGLPFLDPAREARWRRLAPVAVRFASALPLLYTPWLAVGVVGGVMGYDGRMPYGSGQLADLMVMIGVAAVLALACVQLGRALILRAAQAPAEVRASRAPADEGAWPPLPTTAKAGLEPSLAASPSGTGVRKAVIPVR